MASESEIESKVRGQTPDDEEVWRFQGLPARLWVRRLMDGHSSTPSPFHSSSRSPTLSLLLLPESERRVQPGQVDSESQEQQTTIFIIIIIIIIIRIKPTNLHVFALWEEAAVPKESHGNTGRTCNLHTERPLIKMGFEPTRQHC
ncbi:unnamed protein product [Pleuronectes platessa]|uniref:Uncharacterized protein n=1 Tax=Pleuronectes platessa TaxID=8262 RepID=A0A9N7UHB0_PLEPL|nr:unnamed protein product [Pleuronectes platessa]